MIEPDYFRATNKAYEVLNEFDDYSIPTTIFLLIRKFKNIKLYSFSEAAKRNGITYEEFCEIASSKFGFSVIDSNTNNCIIFYNNKKSKEVIRFTLAHELGHYILGHLIDGDKENKEANCFARNFLCPIPIIDVLDIYDCEEYSLLFDVSEPMAKVAVKYRYCDLKNISDYNYFIVKYQFERRQSALRNLK